MLERPSSYQILYEQFRWAIPNRFNIAAACSEKWTRVDASRTALVRVDARGRSTPVSFGTLSRGSSRLAHALRARGVGRGDRVAILLPQSAETVVAHFAAYKLGAIAVPLAALFGPDALRYRLATAGAKAIVTDAAGLAKLAEIRADLPALEAVLCSRRPGRRAEGLREALAPFRGAFAAEATPARRSGADDLHLRHDRTAEGRAARPPRPPRPPARRRRFTHDFFPAGRRPAVDAVRLGLGRRPAQRAAAQPVSRRAGGLRAVRAVRSRGGLRADGRGRVATPSCRRRR